MSLRVVVVETDLRNPTLSRQHGVTVGPGLAELLTRQVGLDEAIQTKPVIAAANGADGADGAEVDASADGGDKTV